MNEERVYELVSEVLEVGREQLDIGSNWSDFSQWDSMAILELLTAFNAEGIAIDPSEVESLRSMKGIMELVSCEHEAE